MRQPARGLLLVRRPDTDPHLPGGRIHLLDDTVQKWTVGQAEVLAVGLPPIPEEEEMPRLARNEAGELEVDLRLEPGAWVLCWHRRWNVTDRADEYTVPITDAIAVFAR